MWLKKVQSMSGHKSHLSDTCPEIRQDGSIKNARNHAPPPKESVHVVEKVLQVSGCKPHAPEHVQTVSGRKYHIDENSAVDVGSQVSCT